jgi:hypothetical protein
MFHVWEEAHDVVDADDAGAEDAGWRSQWGGYKMMAAGGSVPMPLTPVMIHPLVSLSSIILDTDQGNKRVV